MHIYLPLACTILSVGHPLCYPQITEHAIAGWGVLYAPRTLPIPDMPRGILATQPTQGRSRMGCSSWYFHPFQHCCRSSQTCQHISPKDQRNSRRLPKTRAISLAPSPHFRVSPSVAQPDVGQGTSTQPLFPATWSNLTGLGQGMVAWMDMSKEVVYFWKNEKVMSGLWRWHSCKWKMAGCSQIYF